MHDQNYAVNLAQAQVFADSLAAYVDTSSAAIEATEVQLHRARSTGSAKIVRELEAQMHASRRELYDVYRQLDKLVARFPEVKIRRN